MKNELKNQILRNKKFINMYSNDFSKTTNQYFLKTAFLQNLDEDIGVTKLSFVKNQNAPNVPYYANSNNGSGAKSLVSIDQMKQENLAAIILSHRERGKSPTPSLMFSQVSHGSKMNAMPSKHKLTPLVSKRDIY